MRKRMQVKYKDRKLIVAYEQQTGNNEFFTFKVALQEVLEEDTLFVQKLDSHFPVVEYFDDEFEEYFELNHTCTMPPSGSVLHLKFLPSKESKSEDEDESQQQVIEGTSTSCDFQFEPLEPIIKSEATAAEYNICESPPKQNEMQVVGSTNQKEKDQTEQPSTSQKKRAHHKKTPRFTFDNVKLPVFSLMLKEYIDQGLLTPTTPIFVKEVAEHLWALVKYPTPTEYTIYSKALVAKYPGAGMYNPKTGQNHDTLKSAISGRVRNMRRTRNRKPALYSRSWTGPRLDKSTKSNTGMNCNPETKATDDSELEEDFGEFIGSMMDE
ncbi:uncharacterized protein LOC132192880 isoform X3 [Neocloeon triangulifer]|uniref:uncharacterized protein LOC132192880 isoform X3 n=1 Tax=Neocloeon triangulifer TaxID=2078957 RepID=UPI00286EE5FA|nr:uncharacterized protein LOC132192880 isoform X3 [Neocloeon triangulifer]XP_059469060.1 uncharacterized protein LOC132192880 isoform X3 [Neocloeon triangulifer]XP_059469062.1 uncharacterized protein LOC132192880 isoform X3 [Neocloeon triangulifer]